MEYLYKKDTKINRQEFKHIFDTLKKKLNNEWTINYKLVGSSKRNLVLVGNEGYDLDYHIYIVKNPNMQAEDIKNKFRLLLDEIVPKFNLTNCEDSTHVLTTKKIEGNKLIYSYDIALLKKNKKEEYVILKNDKLNNGNGPYHFVEVPKASDFSKKYNEISGTQNWKQLRDIYKKKKESQQDLPKDSRIHSFSLLISSVNELKNE
ncbi:MAG: hypothetical protein AB7E61_06725 [Acholeplasmataceae bacterium]